MPKSPGLSRSNTPFLVAANVALSWFQAVGIPARQLSETKLLVDNRLEVSLFDSSGVKPTDCGLAIDARELASSSTAMAIGAWHRITIALGKGQPNPVSRGTPAAVQWAASPVEDGQEEVQLMVGRKTVKTSDILMSSLRLSEYRQSPDLPKDVEAKYAEVIKSTTGAFYRRNRLALEAQGLTRNDLSMAGLVWATNFHHRYRQETDERKTIKFLGNYIQQRLSQLARYGHFYKSAPVHFHLVDDLDLRCADDGEPTIEDVNDALREKVSYLPREELARRVNKAVAEAPELAPAAKRLMALTPRVGDFLHDF